MSSAEQEDDDVACLGGKVALHYHGESELELDEEGSRTSFQIQSLNSFFAFHHLQVYPQP